eukprot:COSAG06_NODE_1071_length_10820_cov_3.006995_6_plen_138_part_00
MRCAGAVGSHRPAGGPAKRGIDPCLRALGKSRAASGSLSGSVSASLRVAARVSLLEGALILRASEKKERQFRTAERERAAEEVWTNLALQGTPIRTHVRQVRCARLCGQLCGQRAVRRPLRRVRETAQRWRASREEA